VSKRVLVGHVAIESGRLVVVDPVRLDGRGQWPLEPDLHRLHVWGEDADLLVAAITARAGVADARRDESDHWVLTPEPTQPVEALQERAELLASETGWRVRFSYPYRTGAELAATQDQLTFVDGSPGLAVAAATGRDGLFPVYAVIESGEPVRLEVVLSPE
jgi:hypothetical protein